MSESLTLDVGGMTCEGCSNRVKSALESIQGVNSADVSHESGIAIIVHQNVSKEIMTSSVQEIGYTVDGKGEDLSLIHI